MDNLAISFASLVKNNGGLFKSDKQAAFLLSQCVFGEYVSFHRAFNNVSRLHYVCDNKGIKEVVKVNTVKGVKTPTTVWDRENPSIQNAIAEKKAAKHAKKLKAQLRQENAANSVEEYVKAHTGHYSAILTAIQTNMLNGLTASERELLAPIFAKKNLSDIADSGNEYATIAAKLIERKHKIHEKACNKFYK